MLKGWMQRTLGECASINLEQLGGKTDPDFLIEYLDLGAIERPGAIGNSQTFRFGDAPSRARRVARDGDVLVSTVRPYLRKFGRVREAPDNLVVSTGYAVVRPSDDVDNDFLYQHILSNQFVKFLEARMIGSNYPAVTAADVESYPLHLPPPAQQREIGAILQSVDDAVDRAYAIVEQVQVVKRGLLERLLTPAPQDGAAKRWQQVQLGEVVDQRKVMHRPSLHDRRPYVGLEDLAQGTPAILGWRESGEARSAKRVFHTGDVLFGKLRPELRKAALAPFDGTCSTDIIPLYCKRDINPRYLVQLVHSAGMLSHATATSSGTKMPRTSWKQLREFTFQLPSIKAQEQIVAVLSAVDRTREVNEDNLRKLLVLKQSLMAALLIGEPRLTNAFSRRRTKKPSERPSVVA